jgi:TPP-dependent pyruvate/acetoin dehydrogenase alpha subunit
MTQLPEADVFADLYKGMLRIRLLEERIVELYPEQQMRCPVHLCIGQEAVATAVCAHLKPTDYVVSSHRSHGHYVAKGGDLKAMMAEIYGKATGCCEGKGGSMHLLDLSVGYLGSTPIVGSTIPIGVGAAFGARMKGEERVTVVFFGEGATEEGVFHEAANFASLKKLPVVFVCENNLYSVYSPMSVRQPDGREVFNLAKGHGIESRQGDGNDVAEVYELAGEAVEKARRGGGPSFLEFKTYRWREHCGPNFDNDICYRTEAEWRKKCPLENAERVLRDKKWADDAKFAAWRREIAAEIDAAVDFAKQSPFPAREAMADHLYAEAAS